MLNPHTKRANFGDKKHGGQTRLNALLGLGNLQFRIAKVFKKVGG